MSPLHIRALLTRHVRAPLFDYHIIQHMCDLWFEICRAVENYELNTIKYLVSVGATPHAFNYILFRCAAKMGQLETVKYLVSIGANVNADNDMAIVWAAENGHLDVVQYLISVGADYDNHAICWAAHHNKFDVVKYLYSIGASVHTKTDEFRICAAIDYGHASLILNNIIKNKP